MNQTTNEIAYLRFFKFVVDGGIICGLKHPVEWAIQAHRMIYSYAAAPRSIEDEKDIQKMFAKFLVDTCIIDNGITSMLISTNQVLTWCDEHTNEMCKEYFAYTTDDIQKYIDTLNQELQNEL